MRRLLATSLVLLLTACGSGSNPLAGEWHLDGAAHEHAEGGHDHALKADAASDRFSWCCEVGGEHTHFDGTYKVDGERVTLTGKWQHNGKEETASGKVAEGKLSLQFASGVKTFHKH
jgi:hypothetical protein